MSKECKLVTDLNASVWFRIRRNVDDGFLEESTVEAEMARLVEAHKPVHLYRHCMSDLIDKYLDDEGMWGLYVDE